MRAYGKFRSGDQAGELTELTIAANPDVLRSLAQMMLRFANRIEQPGQGVSHVHFRDEMERLNLKSGRYTPDVVLWNPRFK